MAKKFLFPPSPLPLLLSLEDSTPPPPLLSSPLPLINFRVFFQGKRHFRYEIRNFKAAATGGVPVYFSTRVNISLQLSIYQVRFESERFVFTLLQHFFPFHKLQTLFIHRQILIHLRHCDHDQQKTSAFFPITPPIIFH